MSQVRWTPVAASDLDDILFFIAFVAGNAETAERIYFEIRDRIARQISDALPGLHHPDAPDWLYLKYKRWLVFYTPAADGIEIMRVIDAVRDLPRRLKES
ncbi:MAG: type II toxin-antitoxin system RelE/ParE family toxin [Pirellulales bacterium]|nr:type II toxin-antitoxin system RelE/ParE family toxin [Pirellulales bacterium]